MNLLHVLHADKMSLAPGRRVLHADKMSLAPGRRVLHADKVSTLHSSAAAAGRRLSRENVPEQQPNRRLESYLQQVRCLEAANQRLERQIQKELDRKCLRKLDGHLRTMSLLQEQISECLSARARVKLQLLGAELAVFDFSSRCEKVREHRGLLEAGLSNRRRLDEELRLHTLPELQSLLNDQTRELTTLQIKHQQDMHGLLAQMSGGVVVDVQTDESSNLLQLLNDLRQSSVRLLEKNERRFNTQVLSSLEVTSDSPEIVQAELEELRKTASNLEEELTRLRSLNTLLKVSGLEQTETFVLQLDVLQHRADGLRRQLELLLQAADHQVLLDVKSKLEAEIQDYERLLDGQSPERVSRCPLNSEQTPSFSPTASRKVMWHRVVSVQGGNLQTVTQTSGILETKTTNKSTSFHSKDPKISPSISTSCLTESFHNNLTGRINQSAVKFSTIQINPATTGNVIIIPGNETEINEATQFVTHATTSDPSKQNAADLKTETVPRSQMDHTDHHVQAEEPGPAQVELETPSKTESDKVSLKSSEGAQSEVSGDKDVERQEDKEDKERQQGALLVLRFDQNSVLSDTSNKINDVDKGSTIATSSSCSPVSNNNLTSAEIFKLIELETNMRKSVNSVHDIQEEDKVPIESFNLSQSESTVSTSPTDLLSPRTTEVFLSPGETEVTTTDQFPVDLEDHIKSLDSLLSQNEPDACWSPVDTKGCLSPNVEEDEDEEACLNLTEANAHVRPVEKYILSTKEKGPSLSFSRKCTLPEEGRHRGGTTPVKDGESLTFKLFKGKEGRKHTHGSHIDSEPTNQESDLQLSNRLGSLDFRCPGGRSSFGDEALYHESIRYKYKDNNNVQSPGGCSNSGGTTDLSVTVANPSTVLSRNAEAAANERTQGRFRRVSGERMVYSGSLVDTRMSIPTTGSDESLSLAKGSAMSKTQTGRFTGQGSGEWMVYGGSLRRRGSVDATASLPSEGNKESPSVYLMTNPEETGRFGSRGSGEWRVYGGRTGHMSSPARSYILANTEGVENLSAAAQLAASPPPARAGGRFGSAGSGEWRVYGRSAPRLSRAASADRISANDGQVMSLLSSYMSSGPRLSSAGSGGSSSSVVRRSRSVGSGGKLSSSSSADRLSSSPGGHRISCSGRVAYTGSGEWKPVYSSASGRRSSVGSAGRSDGGRTTSSERAQSPAGKMNVSGGSGTASGSKLCGMGSTERVGSRAGGRISSSSGSGRTNSTGGRIISSSDRPIKSTGSGAGGNKERISVCKMAALSISAAGRERSQDRQRQAHRRFQQPTTAKTPLVQRWLTTGVGVTSADPDGLDDIITVTEDLRQ